MIENDPATRSGDRSRTAVVAAAFDEIVLTQVRGQRQMGSTAPKDPSTELLAVAVDGTPLPDANIVSIPRHWTGGDLGSMAAALGVVLYLLAAHPEVQEHLRPNPGDLSTAVDEMLRIDDPFPVSRTTRPTRVNGFALEPGTRIYLNWALANRDEAVLGNPMLIPPKQHARHNLVYGGGIHVCPGRPLTTLELVRTAQELLETTVRIEFAPGEEPVRKTYPMGGWRRVQLRLC